MIRLFASDLDGTLLGATHSVTRPVAASIRRVVESGARFAIATGRTFRSPGDFGFGGLPCDVVCANGSIVLSREGEVLRFATLDPAFVEEALTAFPEAPFLCIGRRHSYVCTSREAYDAEYVAHGLVTRVKDYVRLRAMHAPGMRAADEMLYDQAPSTILENEICKINCRTTDPGLIRELDAFFAERSDKVVNAPFNPSMFEVTRVGVDKGEAIAWLASNYGIEEAEVAVYGDGGNDIAMLERFAPHGHAYAPHGSCDDAKRAASEVIGSNVLYAVPRHMVRTVRGSAS